jgi:hypothetical protein
MLLAQAQRNTDALEAALDALIASMALRPTA